MPPPPFVTCFTTTSFDGFRSSRFGPTLPLALAAASVWHEEQFSENSASPFAVPLRGRGRRGPGGIVAARDQVRHQERGADQDRDHRDQDRDQADTEDRGRRRAFALFGDLGQVLDLVLDRLDRVGERALVVVLALLVTHVTIISGGGEARVVGDELGEARLQALDLLSPRREDEPVEPVALEPAQLEDGGADLQQDGVDLVVGIRRPPLPGSAPAQPPRLRPVARSAPPTARRPGRPRPRARRR